MAKQKYIQYDSLKLYEKNYIKWNLKVSLSEK